MGYDIFDTYTDDGFSGKDLARPAVDKMIKDIKQRKIDVLLIYKLDRLSRRVKDLLELVDVLDEYNVNLYSMNENIDLSTPFGRAAFKMLGTFSELERETIVERMQMGKDARAKAGLYTVPGRNCPFGYIHDKENDRLVINDNEATIIKDMFDLYINHGFSFRKLFDYCREKYDGLRRLNNQMFCKPIIKRPMYAGYFEYKGELIKGTNFEPIISYETFLQAQAKVKQNLTKRSSDNSPYLLTGLVLCRKCGNRYVGKLYDRYSYKPDGTQTKRYKYRSYGCAARVKRDKKYHGESCENMIIPSKTLENEVVTYVKKHRFNSSDETVYKVGYIESMMSEISQEKDKKAKLLDLYLDGNIDKDDYLLRTVEIDSNINRLETVIKSEKEVVQNTPSNSISYINNSIETFDNLDRKHQIILLQFLIKNIIIDSNTIIINFKHDLIKI